jgi:NAD(P)-dependent dehydrogenase (short-subunit alcohol dehydrogenase family)
MNQPLSLDGRVALVTGAAGGVGAAYADMLASRGAKVAVVDRQSLSGGEYETVDRIRAIGGDAISIVGDVCNGGSVRQIVERAVEAFGRIDILINNAGTSDQTADVKGAPDGRLEAQLDIHLRAPMRMINAAWSHLAVSGSGRIINIGSSSAFGVCSGGGDQSADGGEGVWEAAYSIAKSAVFALTRQAAGAGRSYGIKANLIIPWSWSPMVRSNVDGTPFGDWMQKNMRPEQVAALAVFLAHPDCPDSGQFYSAAGGRVTRIIFGAQPPYFNRDLTPEAVRDNWSSISGQPRADGHFDNIFDIQGVESEFAEIQLLLGPAG